MDNNNDLGGKQYSDEEQKILLALALYLKGRDRAHQIDYNTGIRPKHYMQLYTKAAAGIYEMAKALSIGSAMTPAKTKSVAEWVKIITDFSPEEFGCLPYLQAPPPAQSISPGSTKSLPPDTDE